MAEKSGDGRGRGSAQVAANARSAGAAGALSKHASGADTAEPTGALARWRGKLARWLGGEKAAYATGLTLTSPELMRFFAPTSSSGKIVSEESVLALSTNWGCQRLLSETMGSLPVGVYERDARGNAKKTTDHAVADLLLSPNADMTWTEFAETLILNLSGNGNGYSYAARTGAGEVTSLTPIRSRLVTPMRKRGSNTRLTLEEGAVFYRIDDRGQPVDEPRERIWHVKLFGWDGLVGLSPIGAMREAAGFDLALSEFGGLFFSQGGKPSGTVSVPNWLTEDQREVARGNIQQMLGGLANAHRFALFEGGMKPEPWGEMPLKDMEYILLRKFGVQEICRFHRVPPHKVADLERATFSNIEHQGQEFVTDALMPYSTRIESSALKWLFRAKDRARFFIRFNFDAQLRGDSTARAALYQSLLQNGAMNRNEVRAKENLNWVEGLDGYTVNSATVPVDRLDDIVDAQLAAREPAAAAAPMTTDPTQPKASAPVSETKFDIVLPEIFKKDLGIVVQHPEVKKLVEGLKQAEARTERRVHELEQSANARIDALAKKLEDGIAEVAKVGRMPRKPVYDERGEIIGSEVVETLH
jgi:HK97 family phage portal protein